MEIVKNKIGLFLRDIRLKNHMTLHHVAIGTDIDSPLISKIERGERLPTFDQINKFSKFYHIDENELIIMLKAEKILKEYGKCETTLNAIQIVGEQINSYLTKSENELEN